MLKNLTFIGFNGNFLSKLFTTQSRLLMTLRKEAFENILEKVENAGKPAFSPLPKMFFTFPKTNLKF